MDFEAKVASALKKISEDSPSPVAIRHRVLAATAGTSQPASRWRIPTLVAATVGVISLVIAFAASGSSDDGQPASQPAWAVPDSFSPVFCYATVDLDAADNWTSVMLVNREGEPSTVIADYIDLCRKSWESGELNSSPPHVVPDAQAQPRRQAPQLTPCVRADGKLAIFPGGTDVTCAHLGLRRAVDQ